MIRGIVVCTDENGNGLANLLNTDWLHFGRCWCDHSYYQPVLIRFKPRDLGYSLCYCRQSSLL